MIDYSFDVAVALNLREPQVKAVLELFAEGATIPFIARYRKDRTGGLDEVQVQQIQETAKAAQELNERRTFIHKTITDQGKMDEALEKKINAAGTLAELEDIYLPYKPKRKTKAQAAREKGLEPLAQWLLQQEGQPVAAEAARFVTEEVKTSEEALQGARDIIAELINEDAVLRGKMRKLFEDTATLQARVMPDKEQEGIKYKDYFDFSEPIAKIPSHRILAILRAFLEGVLRMGISPEEEVALGMIDQAFVKGTGEASEQVRKAGKDAYRRLLQPSLESEFRSALKQKADEEAIAVFAENLRQLLLGSPLGSKRVLAIDPGYRTGCKVVCLDDKGTLLQNDVIYIHEPGRLHAAEQTIRQLVNRHGMEVFAIGDGTAGRETEMFIKKLDLKLPVFLVNEDGASVYSASETAREEFPDHDVTVRGAVSIGRRLMDPLAELVKIDPKSIGVGQYQHDVNQFRLKEKLDQTVVTCVNAVGVNLNTASKHLLSYVSGIGPSLADGIVRYREESGGFTGRSQLLKVPRLGAKAFEQCAGFLRVKNGKHPLDASAVHPEAYQLVETMAADAGVEVKALIGNEAVIKTIQPEKYVNGQFGLLTIKDILNELRKPGLDPRSEAQVFEFAQIYKIEDVLVGMEVPGIVTNLTRFGAFIDIGVKQDGLVHVSEIAHKYITDPAEALKLGQQVKVKVLEVDVQRSRIALSIKQAEPRPAGDMRAARPPKTTPGNTGNRQPARKDKDLSALDLGDALSALKNKFRK